MDGGLESPPFLYKASSASNRGKDNAASGGGASGSWADAVHGQSGFTKERTGMRGNTLQLCHKGRHNP